MFGGGAITHTPLVLAVRLTSGAQGGRVVGVAYTDTANHVMGVTQFSDNDQLSELQVSSGNSGLCECGGGSAGLPGPAGAKGVLAHDP